MLVSREILTRWKTSLPQVSYRVVAYSQTNFIVWYTFYYRKVFYSSLDFVWYSIYNNF